MGQGLETILAGARQGDDLLGELTDRELVGIAEVHRAREVVRRVHEADQAVDEVGHVAERAGLRAVAEDGDRLRPAAPAG